MTPNTPLMTPNPLSDRLYVWENELTHDQDRDYIINGLKQGFRIIEEHSPIIDAECVNYKSATCTENRPRVEAQLRDEIAKGHYVIT